MAKGRGKHWKENAAARREKGSIKQQIIRNLQAQHARGRGTSKKEDKARDGVTGMKGKIYSDQTLKSYINLNCQAATWMKEQGRTPHDIVEFERMMPDYLTHLISSGCSAWTVHAHASAAAKLYGGSTRDFGVDLPARHQSERVHNVTTERARQSLADRERDLREVATLTGLRRCEMESFHRGDHRDFIAGRTDTLHLDGRKDNTKGGRSRDVRLYHKDAERVRELLRTSARMQREKPFADIDRHLQVHICRHDFAKRNYFHLLDEKRQQGIPTRSWYICRDGSGLRFDRDVAQQVSEMLGHSRVDSAIISYLK